jgi:hypothetical protein
MIRYCAIALNNPGEDLLVVQRVIINPEALENRQFEILAAPAVKEKFPNGRILGWFDSHQAVYNSSDIKLGTLAPPIRTEPRNRRKKGRISDIKRAVDRVFTKRS